MSAAIPKPKLTKTERLVFTLLTTGASSQQVADVLDLSKRTVDFHCANVYSKFGAINRLVAIRIIERSGLDITPESLDAEGRAAYQRLAQGIQKKNSLYSNRTGATR